MSGIGRDGGDYRARGLLGDAVDHLVELNRNFVGTVYRDWKTVAGVSDLPFRH